MEIKGLKSNKQVTIEIALIRALIECYDKYAPLQIRSFEFLEKCVDLYKSIRLLESNEGRIIEQIKDETVQKEIGLSDRPVTTDEWKPE